MTKIVIRQKIDLFRARFLRFKALSKMALAQLFAAVETAKLPRAVTEVIVSYHLNDNLLEQYHHLALINCNSQELRFLTKVCQASLKSRDVKDIILKMLPSRFKGCPADPQLIEMIKSVQLSNDNWITVLTNLLQYYHFDLVKIFILRDLPSDYEIFGSNFSATIRSEIKRTLRSGDHQVLEWYFSVKKESPDIASFSFLAFGIDWENIYNGIDIYLDLLWCCRRRDYHGIRFLAEKIDFHDLTSVLANMANEGHFHACDIIKDIFPDIHMTYDDPDSWGSEALVNHWQLKPKRKSSKTKEEPEQTKEAPDEMKEKARDEQTYYWSAVDDDYDIGYDDFPTFRQEKSPDAESKSKLRRQRRKKLRQAVNK